MSLSIVQLVMATVTLQCSVFLIVTDTLKFQLDMVTVTVQCSVFLMVTVILNCLVPYGHCHTAVFCVPNSHCHFEMFSSLWSLSHCSVQCS